MFRQDIDFHIGRQVVNTFFDSTRTGSNYNSTCSNVMHVFHVN